MTELARTPLGSEASRIAAKLAWEQGGHHGSTDWLLHGVVWQQCQKCWCVVYPPRSLCSRCLSGALEWQQGTGGARLLAGTTIHASFNNFYRHNAPWPVALVVHDNGPVFYVFRESDVVEQGEQVELFTAPDRVGEAVTLAVRPGERMVGSAAVLARRLR